ncbi:MAG: DUF3536 domain-containing protein [Deltaproteobacteria bacterium]|nr:DUF3536 domain-containing protein [Deltaproteobacteria bacterium]
MDKYICIHGHFYQPPRENPWLEEIELQDSAYPYHDWNERITAECYGPNAAARILGPDMKIIDIINNYSKISYNFGPTLLYGMERNKPDVYKALIEADRLSTKNFSGHGSALAQVYNHMIMPLANKRDKYTQVIWGIKDFKKRFGREPEGMWLPETAADTESLEILAELGIKFTILAPRQAKRVKKLGKDGKWENLSEERRIDPTMAYRCSLPSGRNISLFFYNGEISQEVGFGGLLNNGEAFARRLASAFPAQVDERPALVTIATDGESYGHHHHHGDMALSYCLYYIENEKLAKLTNYSEFLEKCPPEYMAEIHDNSSWSCIHGVERWRINCGCNSGGHPGWTQAWRAPLKDAMDWLRDSLVLIFEHEALKYLKDPWGARNDYIDVILNRSRENVEVFLKKHARRELNFDEKVKTLKLLGMQRNAMLMYTSCGWFFDEVSGIETVQVMNYAARAMQLAQDITGVSLEPEYLNILETAPSNVCENAKNAFEMFVKPVRLDLLRVGAHYAISSLFQEDNTEKVSIYCYTARNEDYEKLGGGRFKLAIGRTKLASNITWEEADLSFAVLHLGEHNLNGGIRYFTDEAGYSVMKKDMRSVFEKGDIPDLIRAMDKHFGTNTYNLWHIFKDEQRKIINQILQQRYKEIESSYRQIFEDNYAIMDFLRRLSIPLPRPILASAEYILNLDLKREFGDHLEKERLEDLINNSRKLSITIDGDTIGFKASAWVNSEMEKLEIDPENSERIERIRDVLKLLAPIPVRLNLWKTQNIYFAIGKKLYAQINEKIKKGDGAASRWAGAFGDLGNFVHVKVS